MRYLVQCFFCEASEPAEQRKHVDTGAPLDPATVIPRILHYYHRLKPSGQPASEVKVTTAMPPRVSTLVGISSPRIPTAEPRLRLPTTSPVKNVRRFRWSLLCCRGIDRRSRRAWLYATLDQSRQWGRLTCQMCERAADVLVKLRRCVIVVSRITDAICKQFF